MLYEWLVQEGSPAGGGRCQETRRKSQFVFSAAQQKIDEMSENFLARIEALVTGIGQKMTAGKVYINADDYKAMLPYLTNANFDF